MSSSKADLSLLHNFLSYCPSPPYKAAYLVSGWAEIILAWAPVLTWFCLLVTVLKTFSLCTTQHTCPFTTSTFLLTPCPSVLYLSTLSCVSLTICAVNLLYQVLFFFVLSSSKLTLVLLALVSFTAHNFLFPLCTFFLAVVFHTLRDLLPAATLTYQFPWASSWMLFTELVIDHWLCRNLLSHTANAVSVHCRSLWMVRHLPSPAGAAQGTTPESQKWG